MKNLISIVFLMVWLLNAVSTVAGACGSGQCCCATQNKASVESSLQAAALCGQKECAFTSNTKDTQKEDMALPQGKTSEVNPGILFAESASLRDFSFLRSFKFSSLYLKLPLSDVELYIRYHQFLI